MPNTTSPAEACSDVFSRPHNDGSSMPLPFRKYMRRRSLRLDVGGLDYLAPLLGFGGEEFAEFGRRHDHRLGAELGIAGFHLGRRQRLVERGVDLVDDIGR